MARTINHCGKNLPVEQRYAVSNFPSHGDTTYFDVAKCLTCNKNVHNYWHIYHRSNKPTPVFQTDKHDRGKYDALINSGRAFIIPTMQDEIPRNTKAQVLACEWTLMTIKSADQTAFYLNQNERAPWVSNQSILNIEKQRGMWLRQLLKRQNRVGKSI